MDVVIGLLDGDSQCLQLDPDITCEELRYQLHTLFSIKVEEQRLILHDGNILSDLRQKLVDIPTRTDGKIALQLARVKESLKFSAQEEVIDEWKDCRTYSIDVSLEAEFGGDRLTDTAAKHRGDVVGDREEDIAGSAALAILDQVKPALDKVPEDAERLRALLGAQEQVTIHKLNTRWKTYDTTGTLDAVEIRFAGHLAAIATEFRRDEGYDDRASSCSDN